MLFSKEEIKRAESIDIVDYCSQNDIPIHADSERYYRLVDHDSFVIDRKKNSFFWNSKGVGGNVINFVQHVHGENFKGAMNRLLDPEANYTDTEKVEFVAEPFEYTGEKEVKRFDKARDYLIKERALDPEIVDDLNRQGLIKQDKYNNVLFLWKDEENIVGCTEQGIISSDKYKRGSWKHMQKNSTANHGFNFTLGKPRNLKFFESSIDAISYASLHKHDLKDTRLISMEGLKHNTVFNYIVRAKEELGHMPDSISLCVDNDVAGQEFSKKFEPLSFKRQDGSSYQIEKEIPESPTNALKWDWNDQCKHKKEIQEQQKRTFQMKSRASIMMER